MDKDLFAVCIIVIGEIYRNSQNFVFIKVSRKTTMTCLYKSIDDILSLSGSMLQCFDKAEGMHTMEKVNFFKEDLL